ncbi:MAG: hypothetical protein GQ523_05500 [Methanophagales archaeon]|nr:hypothetical protein [Methanophagales archaeon]
MNFQRRIRRNFSLTLNRLLIMSLTYKENVPDTKLRMPYYALPITHHRSRITQKNELE